MSTANFGTPNFELPLIAGGLDYNEKKERYERDCDGEYEYNEDIFNSDVEWELREMEDEVEGFNDGLKHFEVYIEGGYYEGYMFNVRQKKDDCWDYDDLDEMTEDDAEYFYGDRKANVIAEYKMDMKFIRDYFNELKERGFYELYKVAQFSNGEAIYERAK